MDGMTKISLADRRPRTGSQQEESSSTLLWKLRCFLHPYPTGVMQDNDVVFRKSAKNMTAVESCDKDDPHAMAAV